MREDSGKKNGKVYYSHPVDADELDFLIRSVRESHDFTAEEKESLEKRMTDALGSAYYRYNEHNGRVTRNLSTVEDDKAALIEGKEFIVPFRKRNCLRNGKKMIFDILYA